jgi:rhamnulokinase
MHQDYTDLTARAEKIPSPNIVIDVDDPEFLHPDDMPAAIAAQLRRAESPSVTDPVVLIRAILESLALSYREAVHRVEDVTSVPIRAIHVIGGGSRNALLCQLTADACGRPVLAGPSEATALGNILVQATAHGIVRDLGEARAMVRNSFQLTEYLPTSTIDWKEREARLTTVRSKLRSEPR